MLRILIVLTLLPTLAWADDEKEAQALLKRVVRAIGAEKAVGKPYSFTGVGRGKLMLNAEQKITNRFTMQGLDSARWETDLTNADSTTISLVLGLHAGKLWLSGNGGKASEVEKETAEAFRQGLVALRVLEDPALLMEKGWKLMHLGELKTDGKELVGLKASRKGQADLDVYFDKKTGLPARMEVRLKKPGETAELVLLGKVADHKKVAGRLFFTRLTVFADDKEVLEMEREDMKIDEKVDNATFTTP